jgi:hypothetical protein
MNGSIQVPPTELTQGFGEAAHQAPNPDYLR